MSIGFDTDPAGCADALSRLASAGFSEEAVRSRLGLADLNELQLRAAHIYRQERLRERDALASAIDLFLLQGTVPTTELNRLFSGADQQALTAGGILERRGDFARGQASLYPVGSDLILSDHASHELDDGGGDTAVHDRVMYIGTDSRWLARATIRRPVPAMLDLCCGSGIHALLAASHAEQATAVDINPRAVKCTAFNARLKRLANVEALQGDLYGPIGDRRFELITANPPFVPAPTQQVGFRDGGPSGEDVQRRIIEGLPRHLAKGGTAQIVTELGESDGEPLDRRLRRWLGTAPIDIHVLRLRTHAAQAYAIGHADGADSRAFLESVGAWAANLKAHGYSRIVSVLLAFQWSDGTPWSRVDEAHPPTKSAGLEVQGIFAAERLTRDPALAQRLRAGSIARTGPVAIFEARTLGVDVPPTVHARLFGRALSVEHSLTPLELDLLTGLERPVATTNLLAIAAKLAVPEETVLNALVALVGKGLVQPVVATGVAT